ncbi:MAG: diguanylate cyclase [Actinomycetes bacterium]
MSGWISPSAGRRLLGVAGVALVALITVGTWLVDDPADHFARWGYPAVSLVLLSAACWLLLEPAASSRLRHGLFVTALFMWLARLGYQIRPDGTQDLRDLGASALMSACLMVVFGYIVLPRRRALAVGIGMVAVSSVLMVPRLPASAVDGSVLLVFARYECYLVFTMALVHLLARTKDGVVEAELEAERMRTIAYLDPLTGLPNRRALNELLDTEADYSRRTPLSLIAVDLDHFKEVNDAFGHPVGDRLLRTVADYLQRGLRGGDMVGRWGGEEFLVVCPGSTLQEATELAERLRRALEHEMVTDGHRITGSFGVAEYVPGMSVDSLVARVDRAMYEAKERGRNRVVVVPRIARPRAPRDRVAASEATGHDQPPDVR